MIILKPQASFHGTFKYCNRNNFSNFTYLYDSKYTIYKLEDTFTLSKVGILHPESQLTYNKISFHPTEKTVAVVMSDQSVAVCDFNGNIQNKQAGAYVSIFYTRDGSFIWAIEKLDEKTLCISILDSAGVVLAKHNMEDELYDSYPSFSDIPKSDNIILELAAGQDGIFLYECLYKNAIIIKRFIFPTKSPNTSYITPAWLPSGKKLLSLENDTQAYVSITYPEIDIISEQTVDYNQDMEYDEYQMSGYGMIYLKNGLAVVQNPNYCYFLFDPIKMERLEEIVFQGYEPVPAHKIYKLLKDDNALCSQLVYFYRIADNLLAAKTDEKNNEPLILLVKEDSLTEQCNKWLS